MVHNKGTRHSQLCYHYRQGTLVGRVSAKPQARWNACSCPEAVAYPRACHEVENMLDEEALPHWLWGSMVGMASLTLP